MMKLMFASVNFVRRKIDVVRKSRRFFERLLRMKIMSGVKRIDVVDLRRRGLIGCMMNVKLFIWKRLLRLRLLLRYKRVISRILWVAMMAYLF